MADYAALDGVNVLDLSESIGGAYCSKLLADLGATALIVERPGSGHPLRQAGPYPEDPHPEKSGLFLYYAANKRGIVCDLESEAGRERIRQLARDADILVESFPPGYMDSIGLGYDDLAALNPSLVFTSVTHFGQTGPYAAWKSDEIVDYALGGYMYFGGHADREPLMMNNNQPMLNAGAQAAIASLAALRWARMSGRGQRVDVSAVEAMLSAHAWTSSSWTHEGVIMRRSAPDCIPCADGWVWFFLFRWDPTVFILIDRPELMEDDRFAERQSWFDNRDALVEILAEWCASRTKDEIFRAGQELRIPVTPVNDAADLLSSAQLESRNWFQGVERPLSGRAVLPGFPYAFSDTPASIRAPAPLLDQHSGFSFTRQNRKFDPGRRDPLEPASEPDASQPLSGVRVLELTANWAGPLAARHLADLGADVIKIEAPDRPATRGGRYPRRRPLQVPLRPLRLLQQAQPQQVRRLLEPRFPRRPRSLPASRGGVRRSSRKQQPAGHAKLRPPISRPPRSQPRDNHGIHIRLRADWPRPRLCGVRRQRRGVLRTSRRHRLRGRRPPLPLHPLLRRPRHSRPRRHSHACRPPSPRPVGTRAVR